jgi:hypothetical protein
MPFWVSLILAFAGMVYFPLFFEAIVLLFISDLLYGVKEVRFFNMIFISLVVSVMLFILLEILKKKFRVMYNFKQKR